MDKTLKKALYDAIPHGRLYPWDQMAPAVEGLFDKATLSGNTASLDIEMQGDALTFIVIPPHAGSVEEIAGLVARTRYPNQATKEGEA